MLVPVSKNSPLRIYFAVELPALSFTIMVAIRQSDIPVDFVTTTENAELIITDNESFATDEYDVSQICWIITKKEVLPQKTHNVRIKRNVSIGDMRSVASLIRRSNPLRRVNKKPGRR